MIARNNEYAVGAAAGLRRQGSRRGTVIMLVVAVITLLMVMGTIYVFTTRSERQSSRVSAEGINSDYAWDSVMSQVKDTLFRQTIMPVQSGHSNMSGGLYTPGNILVKPPFWTAQYVYSPGDIVVGSDYQIYQCIAGHTSSVLSATEGPPPVNTGRWAAYAGGGNVSSGFMDYPDKPTAAGWANFDQSTSNVGMPSDTWLVKDLNYGTPGDVSLLLAKRFNPLYGDQLGANGINYAALPPTNVDSGAVVPTTQDGLWQMLSYSSGNVRFRYVVRIVDLSRMANLNVGNFGGTDGGGATVYDTMGQWIPGVRLSQTNGPGGANTGIFQAADAANMSLLQTAYYNSGAGIHGRGISSVGTSAFAGSQFDFTKWQDMMVGGGERYGVNAAAGYATQTVDPFDMSEELELRSLGYIGTSYFPRVVGTLSKPMWYYTLKGGSVNRNYYTTDSMARNLGPDFTPRMSMIISTTQPLISWPGGANSRRMINLSSYTASSDPLEQMDSIARNAIYLANALSAAGFSDDEALSAAVNYAGQAVDQHMIPLYPPVIIGGPSAGLVVGTSTYPIKVNGADPEKTYLAYYAQPYLNEVAVARPVDNDGGVTTYTDFSVELVNPHAGHVDMQNWKIQINGADWITDVGAEVFPTNVPIGAMDKQSFAVVSDKSSVLTIDSAAVQKVKPFGSDPTGAGGACEVTLLRPYRDNTGTLKYAVVDKITCNFPAFVANNTAAVIYSKQRNNKTVGTGASPAPPSMFAGWLAPAPGPTPFTTPTMIPPVAATTDAEAAKTDNPDFWMATCDVNYSDETFSSSPGDAVAHPKSIPPTLGTFNNVPGDGTHYGVELTDRFADGTTPKPGRALARENVGDIQGYMHICHRIVAGAPVTICDILARDESGNSPMPAAIEPSLQFQQETKVRFNFIRDPRAQAVLSVMAGYDRASDGTDQLGNGTVDSIDETRIAGQVNLNTASPQVLHAMIDDYCYNTNTNTFNATLANDMVNAIIGYRDRVSTNLAVYGAAPFNLIPGKGIRSIGELALPLGVVDGNLRFSATPAVYPYVEPVSSKVTLEILHSPTYFRRTAFPNNFTASWTKLFTAGTVRSDTFAVYGYMEAIRIHPNNAGHNNSTNWYDAATEDPTATGVANLRLMTRRWVSIVDRSWCNQPRSAAGFVMPKVVATRDIP